MLNSCARKYLIYSPGCVAQWIECRPINQRVTSSIISLGHMPGLWAGSPVRGEHERQPHIDVSLPLSCPSPLSKNK